MTITTRDGQKVEATVEVVFHYRIKKLKLNSSHDVDPQLILKLDEGLLETLRPLLFHDAERAAAYFKHLNEPR